MKLEVRRKEFIFSDKRPTQACHASTVVRSKDRMIAAWFGGEREGADDVSIWSSFLGDSCWSTPVRVSPSLNIPCWNPVLFAQDEDTVVLFYKLGKTIPGWKTMTVVSRDGGENWSEPAELVPGDETGGRGPVKNKPVRLSDGRLIAPASTEQGAWRCFADVYDQGVWLKCPIPVADSDESEMIQPTLWEYPTGCVHALMRTNRGCLYRSDSTDGGLNWCSAYPTAIYNNNSGIDCSMTRDGILVLICNPVEKNWGLRSPLSVFISTDNGECFRKQLDLETEPAEFSYPSVITEGNRIYIVYTYKRTDIVFCELEIVI